MMIHISLDIAVRALQMLMLAGAVYGGLKSKPIVMIGCFMVVATIAGIESIFPKDGTWLMLLTGKFGAEILIEGMFISSLIMAITFSGAFGLIKLTAKSDTA